MPAIAVFYTLMILIVASMHDHAMRDAGEPRPVASIVLGLLWPLPAILLLVVGLISAACMIDDWRRS